MTSSSVVSSAELQGLLDALPDAVFTTDGTGNIEFLNRAAERLTRRSRAIVVGRPLGEVLLLGSEVDGAPLESPVAVCLRSQASVGPFQASLVESGRVGSRILDISAAPVRDTAGATTGVILIARDVTCAREIARRLTHAATHDPLTGLVNRAEFERRLAGALASTVKDGAEHALAFLDLDGFKRINDTCGHLAGDELLRQLGDILRRRMRGRDTVARLGGDEFGILLEHCTGARAARIAEQVRKSISDHRFPYGTKTYRVGVSIGIARVQDHGACTADVLRAADVGCYMAKRQGGNRVQLSTVPRRPSSIAPRVPGSVLSRVDQCPALSSLRGEDRGERSSGSVREALSRG